MQWGVFFHKEIQSACMLKPSKKNMETVRPRRYIYIVTNAIFLCFKRNGRDLCNN